MKPITIPKHLIREIETTEPPDEERRPTTPHLSYSQLSMYLRCSMQYYFRFAFRITPDR